MHLYVQTGNQFRSQSLKRDIHLNSYFHNYKIRIAMTQAKKKNLPKCLLIVFTMVPVIIRLQFPMKPKKKKKNV